MKNVIEFPCKNIFDKEEFDFCNDKTKEIAENWVLNAPSLEAYGLGLAMASGHALSFIREQYPDVWEKIGEALEIIALGGGLTHDA